ncbi:MAG TPA: hypothetical protein VH595_07515 [Verrucomicrobiae bacterium]|jgi:hypothetical protein|nr:hypothetical protein [Verrucomicrobiae bacterium]
MRNLNQLAWSLLIVGILLSNARSTKADSLIVTSGQTIQLGLSGISTNYSYSSVTVDAGGTLSISGNVTLTVTSNVLINGEITGGSTSQPPPGTDGGNGADGVVVGNVAEDGYGGEDGGNGTNGSSDVPNLTILAKNMVVNGSILFNPQENGGDGGDGGAAGNGADGPTGAAAGWGGPGGVGGNGGNSLFAPYLSIEVAAEGGSLPSAGSFVLGTNGVISLDNMGTGGGGGDGGDSGTGGKGGDGSGGGNGGAGGQGGPTGFGGTGGDGGSSGTLVIRGLGIDLEGQISLRGSDGGDGGDLGTPMDGGNGGNGSPDPAGGIGGRGGNGGDAGNSLLDFNPGGAGGNGGFGGNFYVEVSVAFTNFSKMDFSGGNGGNGGEGQPADTGMGGTGGSGAGGAASGQDGQPSADTPDGPPGFAGANGSMSVINSSWGTVSPNGWQTFGDGILTFGLTNNIHTLILSSTNGPFSIVGQSSDPRLQYDSGAGESVVETNEPVEFQFAYQWLSTNGSVDVFLGGQLVVHLNAPAVLTNGFTESTLILTELPAEVTDELSLTFQLNTVGPAQFELGNISLQGLPQSPFISIGPSPTNSTALSLSWFGSTNENYQVQYSTSLASGTWMNLGPVISGQGAAYALALPAAPGDPARFYRLMTTPAN